jgi:hypothetical protein
MATRPGILIIIKNIMRTAGRDCPFSSDRRSERKRSKKLDAIRKQSGERIAKRPHEAGVFTLMLDSGGRVEL